MLNYWQYFLGIFWKKWDTFKFSIRSHCSQPKSLKKLKYIERTLANVPLWLAKKTFFPQIGFLLFPINLMTLASKSGSQKMERSTFTFFHLPTSSFPHFNTDIYLHFSLSVRFHLHLYVCLFFPSVCLSVYIHFWMYVSLFIYISVCLLTFLSVYFFTFLSVCYFFCLFVRYYLCLCISFY